ncbi:hypothetical protein PstZobell_05148 [Stutzerimonas stutzeri ATCC 14405 = CCUG 16156]|uniref:hypothetical protein n=1 Tax=Stutzerimonas stutzeri TaxID=316 RepID=UPI0002548C75|nr:hypothetical protein [Stutzerimonas stutzeri]EHY76809.1 hypothetical protein PstZobell_05148 [Stutzerimonas stutzeri ATCC 14405 = CCUG 16156]QOZ94085.1 hypothetical protein Pstu14405_01300 [Stutzerimonas stutzeri]
MSALAQLAEHLGLSSDTRPAPATPPAQPAANDPQQPTSPPARPTAPEATSEPKRAAWRITRAGQAIGYMVGQPMTYSEALAAARWRWADAELDGAPKEPNP